VLNFEEHAMSLTVKRVERLMNAGERGRHFDDAGLYLCITGEKAANWSRRYELNHKAHWLGLGSAKAFTLDEARERNREVSKLLADGIDPLHRRQTERAEGKAAQMKTRTFKEAAQEYMQRHQSEWRSADHGRQWRVSLERFVFKKIGDLPVVSIDKAMVLSILEQHIEGDNRYPASGKFWAARTVTADRVRNRIELVLNFAVAAGYRPDGSNPAAWTGLKDLLASPTKSRAKNNHAALPYVEAATFLRELRRHEGAGARALEFLIMTAARPGEVISAQWSEIDLGTKVWTVPAERMKGRREHRVPLSSQTIELLTSLPREKGNGHVFIGPRSEKIGETTMQTLLRRIRQDVTPHGFRSTFSDWAHERSTFNNHVIEICLAHAVGSGVERAYRRGDLFEKRRKLMQAWSDYCCSPAATADVLPLRHKS
jgi:integrase